MGQLLVSLALAILLLLALRLFGGGDHSCVSLFTSFSSCWALAFSASSSCWACWALAFSAFSFSLCFFLSSLFYEKFIVRFNFFV